MRRSKVLVLLMALLVAAASAAAQEPAKARDAAASEELKLSPNVIVSITIGNDEGTGPGRRTYRMVARDHERSEMLMGWRTPIPTSHKSGEPDADGPLTAYVYQNVGVTAKLSVRLVPDGRVLVEGEIEVSGAREQEKPGQNASRPPTIGTFQQALKVLLRENDALRVAEVPDPDGGTLYIELEADILE